MSTTPNPDTTTGTPRVLLVHGEGAQPSPADLEALWRDALGHSLQRDHALSLNSVNVQLIYHADLSASARKNKQAYDPALDLADARNSLHALKTLDNRKKFKRSRYEAVPGQSPAREFFVDIWAPLSRLLGLSTKRIARDLPDLAEYWSLASSFKEPVLERICNAIHSAAAVDEPLLVISHGLGSLYTYDALRNETLKATRIHTWITLGTPLGDDYIRSKLMDSDRPYPNTLVNWHNVAAEDDPISHDCTVADDFAPMLKQRLVSRIKDHHIYNLSERFGRSDPHDALGYLIHPRTTELVAEWLKEFSDTAAPSPPNPDR